ncbi:MAG TPA: dephospho-CoA kinase [Devosiaceae bacterium]|nr:dephospho-CoA kinase [Devosiaceae bacterium]
MIVIGLTGSIASGKSTVAAMFAEAGVPVFSADDAVHALYERAAAGSVGAVFPEALQDGRIDRQALGAVLDKPEALARLEAIIHPMVRQKAAEFVGAQRAGGAPLIVLEIPLLFEAPQAYPVDSTVVTAVDENELRRRALARPGMSPERLDSMLARQMPQDEKRARADFVIDTGQSLAAVRKQVEGIIRACRNAADR